MLPFAIPGMAWDPVRKKYFPASAAAPSSVPSTGRPAKRSKPEDDRPVRPASDRTSMHIGARGRQMLGWQQSLGGPSGAGRDRVNLAQTALTRSQVVNTTYLPMPVGGSFVTTLGTSGDTVIAGDTAGRVHSLKLDNSVEGWNTPLSIPNSGPISAISVQKDLFILTTFGPNPLLLHSSIDISSGARTFSRPEKATDVSCCLYLRGGNVVLGCSSHMMISKAPLFTDFRKVNIQPRSSVLSLCNLDPEIDPAGNVVMSGLRSGAVGQYDMRTPWLDAGRQPALQTRTPVVGLQSCGGWNLASAGMDGTIEIHDLRFNSTAPRPIRAGKGPPSLETRSQPLFSLAGHRNSHTTGLAFQYLPHCRSILAAGEDNVIRLWDCRDGGMIRSERGSALSKGFGSAVTGVVDFVDRTAGQGGVVLGVVQGQQWDILGS